MMTQPLTIRDSVTDKVLAKLVPVQLVPYEPTNYAFLAALVATDEQGNFDLGYSVAFTKQ